MCGLAMRVTVSTRIDELGLRLALGLGLGLVG